LSDQSAVADIGAGTGILTQHFIDKVCLVYAVEPDAGMRRLVEETLGKYPSCRVVPGRAEATTLPDNSVDLISVAQAIHWFDPEPTRSEFLRTLKPGGWLALLRNYTTHNDLNAAIDTILTPEHGVEKSRLARYPQQDQVRFYYGGESFQRFAFPFTLYETWEVFLGAMLSASCAPDEDHPLYPRFEQGARDIFARFSTEGEITIQGETELYLGQLVTT